MSCINLKIKQKKYKKIIWCSKMNKEIDFSSCNNCEFCEYKRPNNSLKRTSIKKKTHKVSARSQACDISDGVRKEVYERDCHKCISCGISVPKECANSHFIKRSAGGLGIAQNVVTQCFECHYKMEHSDESINLLNQTKEYLKKYYGKKWNEDNLYYKKYNF